MTLTFDDNAHKFQVTTPSHRRGLDFARVRFFASLTSGLRPQEAENSLLAGQSLFGSALVPPAILFKAECVVLLPKGENAQTLRNRFEFGFVQGIRESDVHIEFWGRSRRDGRTIAHWSMPGTFEVDTAREIQPWTRIAEKRFDIKGSTPAAGGKTAVRVVAEFDDHPLFFLNRVVPNADHGRPNFLRFISFKRDFHTIFCFRKRATGDFEPISAAAWTIRYDHTVSYADNGDTQSVTDAGSSRFPASASPSDVTALDRQILAMAKAGSSLCTPEVLAARLSASSPGFVRTDFAENVEFDASFWR